MPITTSWEKERGRVVHVCRGDVNVFDLLSSLRDTVADDRFQGTHASIWDLRDGTFQVSQANLDEYASIFLSLTKTGPGSRKVAWIVASHFLEAVIRQFTSEHPWPSEWEVFFSKEEAEAWCSPTELAT